MKDRRIMRAGVAFGVLLSAIAMYTGWWFIVVHETRDAIERWIAEQQPHGIDVTYTNLDFGGYPALVRVRLSDVSIKRADTLDQIRMPELHLALRPWRLGVVSGHFDGQISVLVAKGAGRGVYQLDTRHNTFKTVFDGRTTDIEMSDAIVDHIESNRRYVIDRVRVITSQNELSIHMHDFHLPPDLKTPLGDVLERAAIKLRLQGDAPLRGTDSTALQAWTTGGGAIDISGLNIEHGAIALRGNGTIALDTALQPIGAFTAKVAGYNAALEAFVTAGLMMDGDAKLAKAVLGFLSTRPAPGRPREIDVPLTLQEQTLSAGPVRLFDVPTIYWD